MKLNASKGCYLTQSEDIPFNLREFKSEVDVESPQDMANWKEITADEKTEMENRELFFSVHNIDTKYLKKVNTLIERVKENINAAKLTADEALEFQKYFPTWKEMQGRPVFQGDRLQHDGLLYEVVEPHTVTDTIIPTIDTPVDNATTYFMLVVACDTKENFNEINK